MATKKKVTKVKKNSFLNILAGIVVGGLAGAITMFLLAPKSGEETRQQIVDKGIELRDRATEMMEDTVSQVRATTDKFTTDGRRKAKELLEQGQTLVAEQLDQVSKAALAGKKAVEAA
ncbi:MAG TPA: YtxH domain-containing protein [Anaerolineales bacterium]|nr:YtxH domain-containing protein [Anaerolineales bacterium]